MPLPSFWTRCKVGKQQDFAPLYSPNTSLKKQIGVTLQPDTSFEEALKSVALPVEVVDDVGTRRDEQHLEHVGEKGEDRVVLGISCSLNCLLDQSVSISVLT